MRGRHAFVGGRSGSIREVGERGSMESSLELGRYCDTIRKGEGYRRSYGVEGTYTREFDAAITTFRRGAFLLDVEVS